MKRLVLFIGLALLICSCTPVNLRVQLKPESAEVEYVRANGHRMLKHGSGMYSTQISLGTESGKNINIQVKPETGEPISKNVYVSRTGGFATIQLEESPSIVLNNSNPEEKLPPEIIFIDFKVDRELHFQPINKNKGKKSIYLTYIDYTGKNILLRNLLEKKLKDMGYTISRNPNKTEIFATINLVDHSEKRSRKGINEFVDNKYLFRIIIEQRLPSGQTKMVESYDLSTSTTKGARRTEAATQIAASASENVKNLHASGSGDSVGLRAFFTGNKANAAAQTGTESTKQVINSSALNVREIDSEALFDYYLYREETNVIATIKHVNMQNKDDIIIKKTIDLLSSKLVHIFDI